MIDSTIHQLQQLYEESEVPKGFFDVLARRKNSATVTKVDRILGLLLAEGVPATRTDIVRVMRRLEEINMGRFVIGRKGQPSRMEWSVGVISMARAAAGQTSEIDLTHGPRTIAGFNLCQSLTSRRLGEKSGYECFFDRADGKVCSPESGRWRI